MSIPFKLKLIHKLSQTVLGVFSLEICDSLVERNSRSISLFCARLQFLVYGGTFDILFAQFTALLKELLQLRDTESTIATITSRTVV